MSSTKSLKRRTGYGVSMGQNSALRRAAAATIESLEVRQLLSTAGDNQMPTSLWLEASAVEENLSPGALAGVLQASDPNADETFTYTFVSGEGDTDNALFAIVGNELRTVQAFDFEVRSSYSIRARVTDSGDESVDSVCVVTVTNVNEPPTDIALSNFSVAENMSAGTVVGSLSGTDPDAGTDLGFVLVDGLGDNAEFEIVGGQLSTRAAFNYETRNAYSVTVRAGDGSLTLDKTFTINVGDVNDRPTVGDFGQSLAEDGSLQIDPESQIIFTDPDGDALGGIRILSLPMHGVLRVGGADVALDQVIAAADLNELTYTPHGNYNGTDTIQWTASDGKLFAEAPASINIVVTPVNDRPTDFALTSQTIAENEPAGTVVGRLTTADPDTDDIFSYALVAGQRDTDNALFTMVGDELRTAASFDYEVKNSYSIRVRTTDSGGQSVERALAITVGDVELSDVVVGDQPVGITPQDLRRAYGYDRIAFGGVVGDGTGQTIAIVVWGDHPGFVNSDAAGYLDSDLHKFSVAFGLPDPPSFRKIDENGGSNYPAVKSNLWATEIALDVEWAHAMAPGANIVLVTASTSVEAGIETAKNYPGVSVVAMSWGYNLPGTGFSYYTTPTDHEGVTFVASSGDEGQPGLWPAMNPNVVAVGGTNLTLADGEYGHETGWELGGGGLTPYPQPAYQAGLGYEYRAFPDVSFMAASELYLPVYDSYNGSAASPWLSTGGTSFSAPAWAALFAIVNQGRALSGYDSLDGVSQTLPGLYQLPASDFHDITIGNNGAPAGAGYDLVTGLGTPIADRLATHLAGLFTTSQITGSIYNDLDSDGLSNRYEQSLGGWAVFIDGNDNAVLDEGEARTVTDPWGNYVFDHLAPGTYVVRTVLKDSWEHTTSGSYTLTISAGRSRHGVNFGHGRRGGAATGMVYDDANGNGRRDEGDAPLAGAAIFLDTNQSGQYEVGEPTTVTGADGRFLLENIPVGTLHFVGAAASEERLPTSGTWGVSVSKGQVAEGIELGLTRGSRIEGSIFLDTDGDGAMDKSWTAVENYSQQKWTVYLDLNNDGMLKEGEPSVQTYARYLFGGLTLGTYTVRAIPPGSYQITSPAVGSHAVVFGSLGYAYSRDFCGYREPVGTGIADGYVYAERYGTPLPGVTVFMDEDGDWEHDTQELFQITDSNGRYLFEDIPAKPYLLVVDVPEGWRSRYPLDSFTLAVGQTHTSRFILTQNSEIRTVILDDSNGNGGQDFDEAYNTSGVEAVYLDLNNNGSLEEAEPTARRADTAFYFDGVAPGTYTLRLIPKDGYRLTLGDSTTIVVTGPVSIEKWFGYTPTGTLTTAGTVNQQPTVHDFTQTVVEGSTLEIDPGTQSIFTDADGDDLVAIKVRSLPLQGMLRLHGVDVLPNQIITKADLDGLTYTPSSNYHGTDVIEWTASDGEFFAATPAYIHITVTEVARPLTITGTAGNDLIDIRMNGNLVVLKVNGVKTRTPLAQVASITVNAGSGADTVLINPGVMGVLISGGGGSDTLTGGDGNDTIQGGKGNDLLHGGLGDDFIQGGVGDDALYGDAGKDTLDGGAGRDLMYGGAGADTFLARDGQADTVFGQAGADTATADDLLDIRSSIKTLLV